MVPSLHLNTVRSTNLKTALRIAHDCGYKAVEVTVPQIKPFLDAGYAIKDIKALLDEYHLFPTCVNDVFGVETIRPELRAKAFEEAEWLCTIAEGIGCTTMQVCPFMELEELSWQEAVRLTAKNVAHIADIAAAHHVTVQLETVGFSHINSLKRGLMVMEETGRNNIGLSVDFWHLWAPGGTTLDELAKLDRKLIANAHFCDGKRPCEGEEWDEMLQRAYFPGDGDIPLKDWMDALRATGYEGSCSAEMVSTRIWQDDPELTARRMYEGMARFMTKDEL